MSVSSDQAYRLNRMNSSSFKESLGTKLQEGGGIGHGLHTTVGGAASEDVTISGVAVGDVVFAQIATEGAAPVTIKRAIAGANKITIEFSADPSNDHVVNYFVHKAAS